MKKVEEEVVVKEGDVCLLYIGNFPNSFVRINWIWEAGKKGWWNVNFTKLGLPCDTLTWILSDEHLACHPWTMDKHEMFFQILPRPDLKKEAADIKPEKAKPVKNIFEHGPAEVSKVVSMLSRIPRK